MNNDKNEVAVEATIQVQPIKVIVNLDGKEIAKAICGYTTNYNEKGITSGTEVQEQSEDNLNQLKQGKKTINMIRVKNGLAPLKHCDVETISMDHIQELVTGRKQGMSLRDSLMRSVKEVKETNDFNEVNKLVKQSWILLGVAPNNGEYIFSLGRVEINQEAAPEVPVQKQLKENFSPYTGEKIHDICPNCWIKNNKSYNCGYAKCPGYKLFVLKKSKS